MKLTPFQAKAPLPAIRMVIELFHQFCQKLRVKIAAWPNIVGWAPFLLPYKTAISVPSKGRILSQQIRSFARSPAGAVEETVTLFADGLPFFPFLIRALPSDGGAAGLPPSIYLEIKFC